MKHRCASTGESRTSCGAVRPHCGRPNSRRSASAGLSRMRKSLREGRIADSGRNAQSEHQAAAKVHEDKAERMYARGENAGADEQRTLARADRESAGIAAERAQLSRERDRELRATQPTKTRGHSLTRRSKKRWSDRSRRQRSALVGAGVVQIGLLVLALADLWRRPSAQLRGSRGMWAGLSFVCFAGPLAYFGFGRRR
jgi:hypothetical protein